MGDVVRDSNQAPPSEEICNLTADTPIRNMEYNTKNEPQRNQHEIVDKIRNFVGR
jgi:hypothetical protein